ncbi:MAG: hypothetical protein JWM14_265 [Chitinophagaceae bacterium]|nr:hypothetical protein [Chitinophagaceae bacterium]
MKLEKKGIIDTFLTAIAGVFLKPKHDPQKLSIEKDFRSVISYDVNADLRGFIERGNYTITEYENLNKKHDSVYLKIKPTPGSGFDVPASGVTAYSRYTTSAMDCLVVVKGTQNRWHIYGDNESSINGRGKLKFIRNVD